MKPERECLDLSISTVTSPTPEVKGEEEERQTSVEELERGQKG